MALLLTYTATLGQPAQGEEPSIFGNTTPQVVINEGEPRLTDDFGEPLNSLLSIDDRIAVTTDEVQEGEFNVYGELLIWDLGAARLKKRIKLPARVGAFSRVPGTTQIAVAGGPVGKDFNEAFLQLFDFTTGELLGEWPPHHSFSDRIDLRVSQDGGFVIIEDEGFGKDPVTGRGALVYHAYTLPRTGPALTMSTVPLATQWAAISDPHLAAAHDAPNWMKNVGASDAGFALAESRSGTGLWRTDSWEQVSDMGGPSAQWENWVPSRDGSRLVSWRSGVKGGLTIWDFSEFRVSTIAEPDFYRGIAPAFSESNRFLRYARIDPVDHAVELVSHDLSTEQTVVAHRIASAEFESFWDSEIRAVFSDDGSQLVISPGKAGQVVLVSWDEGGVSAVSTLPMSGREPVFVADDGSRSGFVEDSIENGDKVLYPVVIYESKTGRVVHRWDVYTVGHPPIVAGAFDSASGQVAYTQHTTGASLGYYSGDAVIFDGQRGVTIPGFQVSEEQYPTERIGNAWSTSFARVPGYADPLVVIYTNLGRVATWNPRATRLEHDLQWDSFSPSIQDYENGFRFMQRVIASASGRVFLPLQEGGIRVVDLIEGGESIHRADLWSLPGNGWFAVTPAGWYSASVGGERHVSFRDGETVRSFDQFDAVLNRPDLVAESLGASAETVAALRAAHARRIAVLGREVLTPKDSSTLPQLRLEETAPLICDGETLSIRFAGEVSGGSIGRRGGAGHALEIEALRVLANGVFVEPVSLTNLKGLTSFNEEIEIPLAPGSNFLQFYLEDSEGNRSPAESVQVHRTATAASRDLYVLGVGVSDYQNDPPDLTFPSKDAADIATAFAEAGSSFENVHVKLVLDAEATREGILAARKFLQKSRPGDRAVIFLAGHGLLDSNYDYYFATTDIELENLSDTAMNFAQIESLFTGVAARERLLLIDTCQAGGVDGGLLKELETSIASRPSSLASITPQMEIRGQRFIEELFTDLRKGTGATVLTASGGLELAGESNEWNNGYFTYAVIDSIDNSPRGDRNGDGLLSASELVEEVSTMVLGMSNGTQRPTSRAANLAVDFPIVGVIGEVVLEDPLIFLNRYLNFSSANLEQAATPVERVVKQFAEQVDYFGDRLGHRQIISDIAEYGETYDLRTYRLKGVPTVSLSTDGSVAEIDYEMDFEVGFFEEIDEDVPGQPGVKLKSRAYRNGTLKMHMEIERAGSEWKISVLKTR